MITIQPLICPFCYFMHLNSDIWMWTISTESGLYPNNGFIPFCQLELDNIPVKYNFSWLKHHPPQWKIRQMHHFLTNSTQTAQKEPCLNKEKHTMAMSYRDASLSTVEYMTATKPDTLMHVNTWAFTSNLVLLNGDFCLSVFPLPLLLSVLMWVSTRPGLSCSTDKGHNGKNEWTLDYNYLDSIMTMHMQ